MAQFCAPPYSVYQAFVSVRVTDTASRRAASFKQLYRTRPARRPESTCVLGMGRIRYSTSVSEPRKVRLRVGVYAQLLKQEVCLHTHRELALAHLGKSFTQFAMHTK
jgi:hypothetical protein